MSCSAMTAMSGGLEAALEAEHGKPDLRLRQTPAHPASCRRWSRLASLWSASTCAMRSRAPSLHSAMTTRLPLALQRLRHARARHRTHWHSAARVRPQNCGPAACRHRSRAGVRIGERRQPRQRAGVAPRLPFVFGKIKPVRRQRMIGRAAAPLRAAACAPRNSPRSARAARARHPRPAARARSACRAHSRTAYRACRETAAASAPCRDSGGPRSPPRRADRSTTCRTPPHRPCGIS